MAGGGAQDLGVDRGTQGAQARAKEPAPGLVFWTQAEQGGWVSELLLWYDTVKQVAAVPGDS